MKAPSPIVVRLFRRAVVVAGDRARADVDVLTDRGIADVAQVVDLRAAADAAVLDLDEVADLDALGELRAGSEPCERAEFARGCGCHNRP